MIRPFQADEYVKGLTYAGVLEYVFGYYQDHDDPALRSKTAYVKYSKGPSTPGQYALVYKSSVRRVKPPLSITV